MRALLFFSNQCRSMLEHACKCQRRNLLYAAIVHSVVGDVPVDNETHVMTSSILKDLSTQSSKMLIGIGFVYACS